MTRNEYDEIRPGLLEALDEYAPLSSGELKQKLAEVYGELSEYEIRESMRRLVDDGDLFITKDLKLVLSSKVPTPKWALSKCRT